MRLIIALLFLVVSTAAFAQESHIVAVVNDDIITDGDLLARTKLAELSTGLPDTPDNRARIEPQLLRTLIDEKLQLQEAKRLSIAVTSEDVSNSIANIEKRNNMKPGGLVELLKSRDVPVSAMEDQIRASIAFSKIVQARISEDVQVSDDEVNEAMARLKADVGKPEDRVAEIFLAIDNPSQAEQVSALADRLIDQIRRGANFTAIAQQFSQSPSAAVGGDLGWVTPSEMDPLLAEAVAKMTPGQMSYPIRTPAGIYILYLLERRTLGSTDPNQVSLALDEVVFPLSPTASPQDKARVETQAQQVSAQAKSCDDMARLGAERAPQLSRQIPAIRVSDLDPEMRQPILALKVSEPSRPMPLSGGIGVIMVCSRSDPSGLPTRDEVTDLIARERLDALSRRYMMDLRRGAFIDVRG